MSALRPELGEAAVEPLSPGERGWGEGSDLSEALLTGEARVSGKRDPSPPAPLPRGEGRRAAGEGS